MSKKALIAFAAILWMAPAAVAGMLGWPGIWGGGSAFSDLIVPAPITGGIIHIPSFVVTLILVRLYPGMTERGGAVLRAVILAAAILGLAQLVNIERLFLALTTDMQAGSLRLHHNYFGLCLLSDAALAWTWLTATMRRELSWPMTVGVVLLPAIIYVALSLTTSNRLQENFLAGQSGFSEQRGDGFFWVYTRLPWEAEGFRESALTFLASQGPNSDTNVQDLAVYFTDSLPAAREFAPDAEPIATLCLYEDGTPPAWNTGRGDCFSGHENFSERLQRMYAALPGTMPRDVQTYLIASRICAGAELPDQYDDNEETNYCRYARLEEKRAQLVRTHGEQALEEMLSID